MPWLGALRRRPPQLVDVRTPPEHARGHIGGVMLVPLGELRRRLPELHLDATRPVIAICQSGNRSRPAVRLLRRAGYDARQLAGGMLAWERVRRGQKKGKGT